MRFISTRLSAKEVVKPTNNANGGCSAHKQGQMNLSTRTNTNEVHKQNIKGKLCCKAQEQRQMMLLSTRTSANDVANPKNKSKRG